MLDLPVIDHDNLSNKVYAALCDALIKGQFNPGERIKIRDLAEKLGTSVTPIRDAILRLSHDDAVVFQSARNIQIPVLTKETYLEIRAIRLRLEALAAETAAVVSTRGDIKTLEGIVASNEAALRARDRLAGAEMNQAFHFTLATTAKLPILHSILRRLWLKMGPVIANVYLEGDRDMIDHHYKILEALKNRDPAGAAEAIVDDIQQGGRAILDRVSTNQERPASAKHAATMK